MSFEFIPIEVKCNYWLAKYRRIIYFVLCISFAFLIILALGFLKKQKFQIDPTIVGIGGTLLGAIIGGLFTLLGSVYVNAKQITAAADIRRKNIIYKPLYDDLISNRNIMGINPYPLYVSFEKGPQTMKPHPQYSSWIRIKNDNRLIDTPSFLIERFDSLTETIEKYEESRPTVSSDVQNKINEILQREYSIQCPLVNLGDVILGKIISNDVPKGTLLKEYLEIPYSNAILSDEEYENLDCIVYDECNKLDSVVTLIKTYNTWNLLQDGLIEMLTVLIRTINLKHES